MQMIVIIPCDIKKCSVYFFIHHVDVRKLFGGSRRVVICKTPRDLRRGLHCMCASLTSTLPGSEDSAPRRTFSPGFQKTSESGKSVLHSYETARPCARSCDLASEMCGTHIDGNETVLECLVHVSLAYGGVTHTRNSVGSLTNSHSELQTAAGFLKFIGDPIAYTRHKRLTYRQNKKYLNVNKIT
jgi:hypothetical protein